MAELLRSLASRLREYVGNRRRATRFELRFEVRISLFERTNGKLVAVRAAPVLGHTSDISSQGLGLLVQTIRTGEHYLTGEDRMLRVEIEAGDETIVVDCSPTRYERMDEEGVERCYLVGAEIDTHSDEAKRKWVEFVNRISKA